MFGLALRFSTIYWAASIFLIATSPGPYFDMASDINLAASASAEALITFALVSYVFLSTTYFALSASCSATYLASIDA